MVEEGFGGRIRDREISDGKLLGDELAVERRGKGRKEREARMRKERKREEKEKGEGEE